MIPDRFTKPVTIVIGLGFPLKISRTTEAFDIWPIAPER